MELIPPVYVAFTSTYGVIWLEICSMLSMFLHSPSIPPYIIIALYATHHQVLRNVPILYATDVQVELTDTHMCVILE